MVLELHGVRKAFRTPRGPLEVLGGADLSAGPGDFIAVMGPSGSGKSTLLMVAGAMLEPDAGAVAVAGQKPFELGAEARARFRARHLGFVFQQFHLIPYLNVLDNALAPALALPDPEAPARARELLARFGLADRLEHTPAQLSVGERQRTALARALLNRPRLVLADEPTGNLDADNAELVCGHLRDYAAAGGTVLMVTHDAEVARRANRHFRLEGGRLRPDAPAGRG